MKIKATLVRSGSGVSMSQDFEWQDGRYNSTNIEEFLRMVLQVAEGSQSASTTEVKVSLRDVTLEFPSLSREDIERIKKPPDTRIFIKQMEKQIENLSIIQRLRR